MQPKPPRPTGVTVLAVLNILGGLVGLGLGSLLLLAGALSSSSFATQYPALTSISGISTLLYALGALSLILGILSIVIAIGFLGGKGWAWTLGIVVGIIGIVVSIAQVFLGFSSYLGIIFQIIIIYYLTRPHVKAFFGKGPAMAPAMMPPPAQTP